MECVKLFIVLILIFLFKYSSNSDDGGTAKVSETVIIQNLETLNLKSNQISSSNLYKRPSVSVISLIRNKAHTLPLFLTYLEEQDYPKDRIELWLVTDHNEDNSREILEVWLSRAKNLYHSVHYQYDESEKMREGESNLTHWPEERFLDVIRMKEEALDHARNSWAEFVFVSFNMRF
jgi:hypothetical protein